MKKRFFSILLCLCMVLMLFPVTALAENSDAIELQNMLDNAKPDELVKLNKDYTIDTTLEVKKTVTLDLNGYVIKITGNDRYSVIKVSNEGELTLTDSRPMAGHTGDASLPAGGVITRDDSSMFGGGVHVESGSFTMEGGTIYNCSATSGGGVYVAEGGSFTMTGGTIYNCKANSPGGGGVYVDGGSFTMSGGAISGCRASSGGGVCVSEGSFTMNGGAISGCNASSGGGVFVKKESSFEMSGGTIYDCTCDRGDVLVSDSSFNMTGGTISGRTTDGIGYSCVYVVTGFFTMSGGTIDAGNAVSANDQSTINANGGTIYGTVESWGLILNNATDGGCTEFYGKVMNYKNGAISTSGTISGGIYYGGIQNQNGGTISGNTVTFMKDGRQYALEVVANDSKVVAPTEPKAPEGMTFAGWYIDKELTQKYKFGNTLSDSITLYAGGFEPILTLTVPFTTTVKLGGSEAPGKTTFELALVDSSGNDLKYDDAYFGAVVNTDGAGDYDGELTITAPLSWLEDMLGKGAFVWQYDDGEAGWTYDDTVWCVCLYEEIAARSVGSVPYSLLVYPTYIKDDGSFAPVPNAEPLERMSFTNIYKYSAPNHNTTTIVISGDNKPAEQNPNTGASVAANMSTLSVLTIAAAAAAVLKMKKH